MTQQLVPISLIGKNESTMRPPFLPSRTPTPTPTPTPTVAPTVLNNIIPQQKAVFPTPVYSSRYSFFMEERTIKLCSSMSNQISPRISSDEITLWCEGKNKKQKKAKKKHAKKRGKIVNLRRCRN